MRPAAGRRLFFRHGSNHNEPVAEVLLHARRMFDPEQSFSMRDDGLWPDQEAADGIYTAEIPAEFGGPGQMVRWYFTAEDAAGRLTRDPLFPHPTDSPQYYGTVISDPNVTSQIPVFEWFVENVWASETRSGSRGSLYYNGRFYDNVFIRIRGGSTAGMPKRHFKFDFNRGSTLFMTTTPRPYEINLNMYLQRQGLYSPTVGL